VRGPHGPRTGAEQEGPLPHLLGGLSPRRHPAQHAAAARDREEERLRRRRDEGPGVPVSRRAEEIRRVVFYTTGELPIGDAEKANLLAWIKSGKGFIGIHCATDTFYKWADYGDMIGGYFNEHPWHQEVKIKVEDPNTPATKGLPNPWVLNDEIYQFKNWDRSKLHVLLSLDPSSVDLTKPTVHRTDRDFANAWTKTYGDGRVFYSALGHRSDLWQSPEYQAFLAGGIRWTLGLEN
jgi:type 1 glutamine amidotransferase